MGLKIWLPETEKAITSIPCMPDNDKSRGTKHCTWLNKDVPSSECFDWCYKADRIPSTCKHFKIWCRVRKIGYFD
jgi:hypothetical protein